MKFINKSVFIEYCPLCRAAANMIATVTQRAIANKDGKMKAISTGTHHCGSCGSFVRSIDEGEDAASTAAA
jgi:hypothetical protein